MAAPTFLVNGPDDRPDGAATQVPPVNCIYPAGKAAALDPIDALRHE